MLNFVWIYGSNIDANLRRYQIILKQITSFLRPWKIYKFTRDFKKLAELANFANSVKSLVNL